MNVWSYWHCDACDNIIRGDSRTCPCCGRPMPNNNHYLMPDNPEVIEARNQNRIIIGNPIIRTAETYTDENGIEADVVPDDLESADPNWNCDYCGYQNYYTDLTCQGCGAESGHYNTLLEATLMWNKRTSDLTPKPVKVPIELTKHRVRIDLTEFVIRQLKPCTETDTSSINYLDVANNISSYDDNWCNSNEEINITPEIDSIVNQIMNKLFDKA